MGIILFLQKTLSDTMLNLAHSLNFSIYQPVHCIYVSSDFVQTFVNRSHPMEFMLVSSIDTVGA